jgi:dipeptidase E
MKLYLSSYRLGSDKAKLPELSASNHQAVIIANALDYSDDILRIQSGTANEIIELQELGFKIEQLDLREYFGKPALLQEKLEDVGLIWVRGGNTFLLRKAMAQSGLDQYLIDRKGDDSLVYAGYSAAVCVVTPSLRGIELVDPPDVAADGYDDAIIWEGLALVSYSIAPHYHSDHPESPLIDKTIDYFIDHKMLFKAIRDGETIITRA